MKKLWLHFLVLPLFTSAQNNQPCNIDSYTPKWVPLADFTASYGQNQKLRVTNFHQAKMKPHLQSALAWIRGKASSVTGSKLAEYYNLFHPGYPEKEQLYGNYWYAATARISYYNLKVMSRGLQCDDNRLITLIGPANILIYFNYVREIAKPVQKNDDKGISIPVSINGKPVFEVPEIKRTEGRVDYYEYPGAVPDYVVNYSKWEFINGYIIRNGDQPLFIPFTRKEYLQQYLLEMESFYKKQREMMLKFTIVTSREDIDKELKERIAEIKKFTEQGVWGYSKENMEQRIKKAEEFYQNKKEEEASKIKNITKEADDNYTASVQLIKDYLQKKPAAELNNPVAYKFGDKLVNALYEVSNTRRMLNELEAKPGERSWGLNKQLCYINKDYFNNALPPDVPQFIAIEFVNIENVHKHLNAIVANINREYDFSALKMLLNKPPQPATASPLKTGEKSYISFYQKQIH